MSDFAIKLQTAAGAKEVFRKYSVCASDGRIRSARTQIGGGLKQIRDMGIGADEYAIYGSLVADPDKVVFVELRRGTSHRQMQIAWAEGEQKLLDAGYDSQKAKHAHHFQQLRAQINADITSALCLRGESTLVTFFHDTQVLNTTPMYFLPWDPAGGVVQLTIPNKRWTLPDDKHPRIFLTAALSGCSVFVDGTAQNPTIYHAGTDANTPTDRAAEDFWKDALRQLGGDPATAQSIHNTDYIEAKHHGTKTVPRHEAKAKKTLEKHYDKNLGIEQVSAWGAVFGIRDKGDWTFYLQENATITYHKVKATTGGDMATDGPSRVVSRPLRVREIFPGGGGAVKFFQSWRSLKF